jgi:predicted neuraminidase
VPHKAGKYRGIMVPRSRTNLEQNGVDKSSKSDSGLDGIVLHDGRGLLVYNHNTRKRTPLNLAVSHDGEEWLTTLTLEDRPGEFSYPSVIQTPDDLVHVVYTWNRRRIKHVILDPSQSSW